MAFKSMLRRKGVRVVSITEHADDTPTGKLMEAIIESVDEFYSENLAQEVTRGMREAASRGFWVTSRVPYGYRKLLVQDGARKRPTLEPDPDTSPVVKRMFDLAQAGKGILDICRTLNDEGIANPTGKLWSKNGVHIVLKNETYTGTLIWGTNAKDKAEPVRVEKPSPPSSPRPSSAGSTGRCAPAPPKRSIPAAWQAPTCSAGWSSATSAGGRCRARTPRAASSPTTCASPYRSGAAGPATPPG